MLSWVRQCGTHISPEPTIQQLAPIYTACEQEHIGISLSIAISQSR